MSLLHSEWDIVTHTTLKEVIEKKMYSHSTNLQVGDDDYTSNETVYYC